MLLWCGEKKKKRLETGIEVIDDGCMHMTAVILDHDVVSGEGYIGLMS
jgi:hypothetical protein